MRVLTKGETGAPGVLALAAALPTAAPAVRTTPEKSRKLEPPATSLGEDQPCTRTAQGMPDQRQHTERHPCRDTVWLELPPRPVQAHLREPVHSVGPAQAVDEVVQQLVQGGAVAGAQVPQQLLVVHQLLALQALIEQGPQEGVHHPQVGPGVGLLSSLYVSCGVRCQPSRKSCTKALNPKPSLLGGELVLKTAQKCIDPGSSRR